MQEQLYKTRMLFEDFNTVLNQDTLSYSLRPYFTEYILIVMYSELEKKMLVIIGDYLKSHSNEILSNFLTSNLQTIFNRVDKKDIKKTLIMLGKNKNFDKNLLPEEIKRYESFIENRHSVAHHSKTINISWEEISRTIDTTEKIINIFKRVLCNT